MKMRFNEVPWWGSSLVMYGESLRRQIAGQGYQNSDQNRRYSMGQAFLPHGLGLPGICGGRFAFRGSWLFAREDKEVREPFEPLTGDDSRKRFFIQARFFRMQAPRQLRYSVGRRDVTTTITAESASTPACLPGANFHCSRAAMAGFVSDGTSSSTEVEAIFPCASTEL